MKPDIDTLAATRPRRSRRGNQIAPIDQRPADIILSVLYVSHSLIALAETEEAVQHLVSDAIRANNGAGITGALICTGRSFAQYLEGHPSNIVPLMTKIRADHRHDNMLILREIPVIERRFVGWNLAYNGLSPLVTAIVDRARLSHKAGSERGISNLIIFMERFAVRAVTLQ